MTLPILYSRTSTGKVQTWAIEVDGPKYRTVSGQEDGAKITSEWTVCSGKNLGRANETTPEQQALAEAQAKHKKKLESGYKLDKADIDKSDYVEPMLAKEFGANASKVKFPVYAQPKLDGMRCIVTRHGMFSRNGKPILSAPHIRAALEPVFLRMPNIVIDGELYADKFKDDFNAIISLAKKAKPTKEDLDASAAHLQYWVYDIAISEPPMPFSARHVALATLVNSVRHPAIVLVETVKVIDQEQLDALYERWVSEGMEGQMVRLDKAYEHKRTASLLKRKEFKDEEFEIVDVVEGTGNKSGMAGAVTIKMPNGRTCSCNVMGGTEFSVRLLHNKHKVIGKLGTVKYFNMTPDGFPRFPYLKAIRDYE